MKHADLRIAFFGNPPLAEAVLDELAVAGISPLLIITEPDRPGRRGKSPVPAPMKVWAESHDIEVMQPSSLREGADLDALYNSEWDLFIVASYGKILPKALLDLPRRGTLNVHPSLLPKYRGPSPVRSQLLADDAHCGVSVMLLDEQMDHGPILAQASIEPEPWPLPAPLLEDLLAREGAKLLAEVLPEWMAGTLEALPQEHAVATLTKKIGKEDGKLNMEHHAPYDHYLKFCAYAGWPGTFFVSERKDGASLRIKITDAEYKGGEFVIKKVIPEGKKEVSYEVYMRAL